MTYKTHAHTHTFVLLNISISAKFNQINQIRICVNIDFTIFFWGKFDFISVCFIPMNIILIVYSAFLGLLFIST